MLTHHSCRPGGISATRGEGYSVRVLCRGDKKQTKHLPFEHMRTFTFPCFCANKPFVLMSLCCKHGNKVNDIIARRKHLLLRFAISQRFVFPQPLNGPAKPRWGQSGRLIKCIIRAEHRSVPSRAAITFRADRWSVKPPETSHFSPASIQETH